MSNKELIAELQKWADRIVWIEAAKPRDRLLRAIAALEAAETPTTVEWGVRWGDNFRGFGIVELNDQASCSQYVQKDADGSDDLVIVKRNVTPWEVTP